MQAFFAPLRINFCDALSCFDLHLAGEHEPQVIFGVHRQVFDQTAPEVFAEFRHLIWQALQRCDESPIDVQISPPSEGFTPLHPLPQMRSA